MRVFFIKHSHFYVFLSHFKDLVLFYHFTCYYCIIILPSDKVVVWVMLMADEKASWCDINKKAFCIRKTPPGRLQSLGWCFYDIQLLWQNTLSESASVQTHIFSQLKSGLLVKCLPLRIFSWIFQLRFQFLPI